MAPVTTTTRPDGPLGAFSLVVPDDVRYQGGGEDLELTGPSLLAIDPRGRVYLNDPEAAALRWFRGDTEAVMLLRPMDVLNVTALAAGSDHLLVVEVFYGPVRQRVHRIGTDGVIIETVEIPIGLQLEDGLSGVHVGPNGEMVIEMAGGAEWGIWDGGPEWQLTRTLDLGGTRVMTLSPDIEINRNRITADLVGPFGGLRWLGSAVDGTVVLGREDVLQTDPVFVVLSTVEWYTPDGAFLGSARVPSIEDQYTDNVPGLAVSADGRVFALITAERSVDLVELVRQAERIVAP